MKKRYTEEQIIGVLKEAEAGTHREYNEEEPKKELCGLTPVGYAAQMAAEAAI